MVMYTYYLLLSVSEVQGGLTSLFFFVTENDWYDQVIIEYKGLLEYNI